MVKPESSSCERYRNLHNDLD